MEFHDCDVKDKRVFSFFLVLLCNADGLEIQLIQYSRMQESIQGITLLLL